MKRLLILSVCGLSAALLLGGCRNYGRSKKTVAAEVIVEGGGEFPQSLAGTWKARTRRWQITLAPDGHIVSFVNALGTSMVMAEGGLYEDGPEEGTFLYFVFGPCYTNYNPATRELDVTITLDDFHMQLPEEVFEASMKYHITGPVSEDSSRWDTKLTVYVFPKGERAAEPNLMGPQQPMVFDKVEDVQPEPLKDQ